MKPAVSIGLPVFNGEAYVEQAICSVLEQTTDDLELIISDNASSDRTEEICRAYVGQDSRIRYFRRDRNEGGANNLNFVWEHSSGEYFKWIAHDDRLKPEYLSVTKAMLERTADAVLCNTVIEYIDDGGYVLGTYRSVIKDCDEASPAMRFAQIVLYPHTCVDIFGLIRSVALKDSLLHRQFRGSDRALLAQLALRGRLIQVHEPLVQMRRHKNQYSEMGDVRDQIAWYDPNRTTRAELSTWKLFRTYRKLVLIEDLTQSERAKSKKVLRRFWLRAWTVGRLMAEGLSVAFPRLPSLVRTMGMKLNLKGSPRLSR